MTVCILPISFKLWNPLAWCMDFLQFSMPWNQVLCGRRRIRSRPHYLSSNFLPYSWHISCTHEITVSLPYARLPEVLLVADTSVHKTPTTTHLSPPQSTHLTGISPDPPLNGLRCPKCMEATTSRASSPLREHQSSVGPGRRLLQESGLQENKEAEWWGDVSWTLMPAEI